MQPKKPELLLLPGIRRLCSGHVCSADVLGPSNPAAGITCQACNARRRSEAGRDRADAPERRGWGNRHPGAAGGHREDRVCADDPGAVSPIR